MPYYIAQFGTALKLVSTSGALTTLTLPTNVNLDSSKRLRGVLLGGLAIFCNSPNYNITVDRFRRVRMLCPPTPTMKPVLTTAASGTLSGTFQVKETFIIKDEFGNLIAETPFGPTSAASSTLANNYLVASNLSTCPIDIRGLSRRLYRTTTGPGTTFFPWIDVDGNRLTSVQNDLSDAALQLVAAPTDLGQPPRFELITAWKNRVWGKPASFDGKDTLYYSAVLRPFAFPSTNTFQIPPENNDATGITGFLARKDELGVGRRTSLNKIVASTTSFSRYTVTEEIGIWAPDSCTVIHDVGYFLGNPFGVYSWGPGGIKSISDERVHPWFSTDTYFNRSMFDQAVGSYDPSLNMYVILLAAAGSSNLDRWIGYDIGTGKWWGPHKTGEFTPTGIARLQNSNNTPIIAFLGSDGKLYQQQTTKTDGSSTAIDFDCTTNWLSGGTPTVHKTWLRPRIQTEIQSGGALTVTPTVGKTNSSAGSAISHDMTLGNEELPLLGDGHLAQLRLRENTAGQDVTVYGIELPFLENGVRG